MAAQVTGYDLLGKTLDGVFSLGQQYFDADQAQEVPDYEALVAAQAAQQQQAAQESAQRTQNLLIMGGVAVALFLLVKS